MFLFTNNINIISVQEDRIRTTVSLWLTRINFIKQVSQESLRFAFNWKIHIYASLEFDEKEFYQHGIKLTAISIFSFSKRQ